MDRTYRPRLIKKARNLRENNTPTENILWRELRQRFSKFKFRRQHPIGPYIADFFCAKAKLIIELDGESHVGKENYDLNRMQFFKSQGLDVIRVWDTDVYENLDGLLQHIQNQLHSKK